MRTMTTMSELAARERGADLRRAAEQRIPGTRRIAGALPAIELRMAGPRDAEAVRRLALLDERPELEGAVLLGIVDGRAAAAVSLDDGRIIADPFIRTDQVVALLRVRVQPSPDAPAWRRLQRRMRLRPVTT